MLFAHQKKTRWFNQSINSYGNTKAYVQNKVLKYSQRKKGSTVHTCHDTAPMNQLSLLSPVTTNNLNCIQKTNTNQSTVHLTDSIHSIRDALQIFSNRYLYHFPQSLRHKSTSKLKLVSCFKVVLRNNAQSCHTATKRNRSSPLSFLTRLKVETRALHGPHHSW